MRHFYFWPAIFSLLLLLGINPFSLGQTRFLDSWLSAPTSFSKEWDELLEINEVDQFDTLGLQDVLLLENGYASSVFRNPNAWNKGIKERSVQEITLIFTRYPVKKEDWITNYYELMANRFQALFALDSSLNDTSIAFRILLQTGCKTESMAKSFFHGFQIRYRQEKKVGENTMPPIKKQESSIRENLLRKKRSSKTSEEGKVFFPGFDGHSVSGKPALPSATKKKRKDTPCPDFSKKKRF